MPDTQALEALLARCTVKHIIKNGARFHAPSWAFYEGPRGEASIQWCSEPWCESNRYGIRRLAEIGLDLMKYAPGAKLAIERQP